nr:MAG TPA: minor tail protein [Caudoviricetes sp.]
MAGSTGRKISTFIELGGEQAFKKAVSDAARSVQVLNAGMKAATAEFEATGDAQTYLTNKAETLRAKMEEQKKYIDLLNYGMDEYVAMGEKGAKKADEQAIKIANATVALQKMKAELEDVESGEAAFQHEMKQAEAQMGALDASLKALEAEYKATGNATQYFADKNTLLHSRIAQQESIVKGLDDAVRRSASRYGEASAETEQYRAKLATATAKLFDMRRELETADREAEEFGRDSVKVGRQIENGIGDGAEEAQKSMKGLIEQMQEDIGSIKGSATFTVAHQVINTVVGAFNNLQDFVTSNQEYRRKVANFEAAARIGNHSIEEMRKVAASLGAFLGDYDTAMQAVTTLMQTGMTGSGISRAADLFAYFNKMLGEEAKVEDLAESFQESVNTGKATGKLAELAGRLGTYGISEDGLNAILGKSGTIESKALNALTYLSKAYDSKIEEIYDEQTKGLQEAAAAQIELTQAWAEIAEEVEPIVTAFTKKAVTIVDALGNALKGMKGLLSGDEQAIFDGKTSEEVAKEAVEANKKYMEEQGQENNFQNGWLSFWNINIGQKESAEDSGQKTATEYADALIEELEGKRPTVQDIIDTYWQVAGTEGDAEASVNKLIEQMNPTDAEIEEIKERFSQIGADINLIFGTVEENSVTSGSNAGTSFGNGFRAAMGPVVRDAWTYANQINAALASIGSGLGNVPIYSGGYRAAAGSGGNLNIGLTSNINLNGRRLAQVVDSYQGKKANRLS